ncbi:MAG: fibronectin type III domain-containing protein [Gammaproteobacteria bacterium]|nr:fibronectin type III domain-containing protein [Gammaproteobacteria bacterium]
MTTQTGNISGDGSLVGYKMFQASTRYPKPSIPSRLFGALGLMLAFHSLDVLAGQLNLAWDPNSEPEVAGYRLYYGQASGEYTASVDVGQQSQFTLFGLEVGQRYYFAVTAYSALGFQSGFSNEVSAVIGTDARDTFLESPTNGSFESGIGLIRGWACGASNVDVAIDGGERLATAYGTRRGDTAAVCGKDDTGFGLTINWNTLGDGMHELSAYADGVEFADVAFNVTTLGADYLEGIDAEYSLSDFPQLGNQTRIAWSEPHQNFVIVGYDNASSFALRNSLSPVETYDESLGFFLESPSEGSYESGIGLVRGWVCNASGVDVRIDDGDPLSTAYGTYRGDTTAVCGTPFTGFGLTFNWNELGDGPHLLRAFADGVEFASAVFNVTTLGTNYLYDASSQTYTLTGFPFPDRDTRVRWSPAHQNFVIVGSD